MITMTRNMRTRPCSSALVFGRRRGTASSTEAMGISATVRPRNRIFSRKISDTAGPNTWPTVWVYEAKPAAVKPYTDR